LPLHLREHNAHWDYFAGMSHEAIERFCLTPSPAPAHLASLGKRAAGNRKNTPSRANLAYSSYQFR
jgi:hypothetical protein